MKQDQMNINWFPGHMAKSKKEIEKIISISDLVIIVLDSRYPLKTYNNDINKLIKNKNVLIVLSKSDLRDTTKDNECKKLLKFENFIFLNSKSTIDRFKLINKINTLSKKIKELFYSKGIHNKKIKIFVMGMPNVGKSSLINLLLKQNKLKFENRPGVTKQLTWSNIDDFYLLDTPGIMPTKIEDQTTGFLLIFLQIIKESIINQKTFFVNCILEINKHYPSYLYELGFENCDNETNIDLELVKYCQKNNLSESQAIIKIISFLRKKKYTFL